MKYDKQETEHTDCGFRYIVRNGSAVIVGVSNGGVFTDLTTLPKELGGLPVTEIRFEALGLSEPPPATQRNDKGVPRAPDGVCYNANRTELKTVSEAFAGELIIPASVKKIAVDAFKSCHELTSISVDAGNEYFASANGMLLNKDKRTLLAIPPATRGLCRIPASVVDLGSFSFSWPVGITGFDVAKTNPAFGSVDGVLYSKDMRTLIACAQKWAGHLRIPNGVMCVSGQAFVCCAELTRISLPSSVLEFGSFVCCDKLAAIDVDEGNALFRSVDGVLYSKDMERLIACPQAFLGKLRIPDGVAKIEDVALWMCRGLTELWLPASLTDIGGLLKANFTAELTAINVAEEHPLFRSEQGVLYSKDKKELIRFPEGKGGCFTVPPEVDSIADHAFCYCNKAARIEVPQTVIRIGDRAFEGCEDNIDIDRRVRLDIY